MVDLSTYQKMHPQEHPRDTNRHGEDQEKLSEEEMEAEEAPKGNFLLLLPRTVRGFNMQAKEWREIYHLM
jgi:hypothetical protein